MTSVEIGTNYLHGIPVPVVQDNITQLMYLIPMVSGAGLEITSSALSIIQWKAPDEDFFTAKEMLEIKRSLIDLQIGNYKSFKKTDELFADLDSE